MHEGDYALYYYLGVPNRVPPANATRRLVAYTFHPTDPFAISVQKTHTDYVVNFHVRLEPGGADARKPEAYNLVSGEDDESENE